MSNFQNGIQYHRNDGIKGDYDRLQSEQEVISLLKNGRPDPYDVCPTYESQSFSIELISMDDTEIFLNVIVTLNHNGFLIIDHFRL